MKCRHASPAAVAMWGGERRRGAGRARALNTPLVDHKDIARSQTRIPALPRRLYPWPGQLYPAGGTGFMAVGALKGETRCRTAIKGGRRSVKSRLVPC